MCDYKKQKCVPRTVERDGFDGLQVLYQNLGMEFKVIKKKYLSFSVTNLLTKNGNRNSRTNNNSQLLYLFPIDVILQHPLLKRM